MLGGWDSSYTGDLEMPGVWLNSEESHRYSVETTQERLTLLQRQHHRGDESWTLGRKAWDAYFTYQSRTGQQVLQASLSPCFFTGYQGTADIPSSFPRSSSCTIQPFLFLWFFHPLSFGPPCCSSWLSSLPSLFLFPSAHMAKLAWSCPLQTLTNVLVSGYTLLLTIINFLFHHN